MLIVRRKKVATFFCIRFTIYIFFYNSLTLKLGDALAKKISIFSSWKFLFIKQFSVPTHSTKLMILLLFNILMQYIILSYLIQYIIHFF